jgi:hypothetical protein
MNRTGSHLAQAKGAWCGTKAPDVEVQIQVMNTIHTWRERKRRRRLTSGPYTVNVRFVDIKASDADADVPQADIDASMAQLNERFASSDFTFTLLETVRVVNSEFATCGFTDRDKHKLIGAEYREGDATVMNVYLCDIPEADRAAISYYPFTVPLDFDLDGVYMNPVFVGEGEDTLAHEAGHWLGTWEHVQYWMIDWSHSPLVVLLLLETSTCFVTPRKSSRISICFFSYFFKIQIIV